MAQLAVLVFNTDADLFVATVDHPGGMSCGGVRAAALWCLAADAPGVARAITAVLVVAAGYRPRWTCVPHWYATASMAVAMPMANGGDKIAQIVTLLRVPLLLGDDRAWVWSRPTAPPAPVRQGVDLAALVVLRVQIAVIYLYAALSKLGDPCGRRAARCPSCSPTRTSAWRRRCGRSRSPR